MIKVETLQVISLTSQSSLPRITSLSMFLTQKSTLNAHHHGDKGNVGHHGDKGNVGDKAEHDYMKSCI